MDRFDQLRTLVRVADLGSFSRAADDLERSRALISQPEHAVEGPPISVVHAQASRHSAKVRVFADFAARLLRDWSQRIHARAGA